ncbi:glycine cleavage complex t-protein, putative [Theileria annulata]|uniref:Glycine cleavage complex t-protein, putative n=1 Tax=Theileria annulata TaxID=5874 RepID=Q4UH30_THEAN|nr:glycine cleavage complex t-protein, putative [Theileria annulata]CAI73609.1 glycine cleavage complex t-protein, putative [Theileria annulata]|eukprot:XP_954286.1 glycine cleavage complex t-protein, putative [Theileria annulata]
MLFISKILRRNVVPTKINQNAVENQNKFGSKWFKSRGWSRDPLCTLDNIPQFQDEHLNHTIDSCVDLDRKIIKQIISLRNNKDESFETLSDNIYNDDNHIDSHYKSCLNESSSPTYRLGQDYLDILFNHRISQNPSKQLSDKINHILEYTSNYNHLSSVHLPLKIHSNNKNKELNIDKIDSPNDHDISQFSDYFHLRQFSSLFHKYFTHSIKVYGLSPMSLNDVSHSFLLDSNGVVIDTCLLVKLDGFYLLIVNGNKKNVLLDYISAYAVHLKGIGMDISVNPLENQTVVVLYGPKSYNVLSKLLSEKSQEISIYEPDGSLEKPTSQYLRYFMKKRIVCYRVLDVEDGFEFVIPNEYRSEFEELLLSIESVKTIGFETYDIARLESGIIRPDLDLTPESTPMHCSLMWNLDINKIRKRIVFGHKHLGRAMVDGVSKVRVGLISNKMITPSCTILTSSTRMPIGKITSSAFSPALGMYIAHCYVNCDYAKHDLPVVISIPRQPDDSVSKSKYKKYYRTGILKSFCRGTIVRLPFLKSRYQVKDQEKRLRNNSLVLNKKAEESCVSKEIIKEESREARKTRKQIWKDVIRNHRKKLNKTLEMACNKWEEINEESVNNEFEEKEGTHEFKITERINIIPEAKIDLKDVLEYYKARHDVEVTHRHRRYRPIQYTIN